MRRHELLKLAIAVGDELPTEFRIFVAGLNRTENGDLIFDEQAAADVMAAYEAHGVDRMIDLEHLSLEDPERSRNFDPDARGYLKLELRDDGSLWAVAVRWTTDGARRLRERTQRFISPAVLYDVETLRVTKLINVAITAMPATHRTPELMAARLNAENNMPKLKKCAEAMGLSVAAFRERIAKNAMTIDQLKKIATILGLGADASVHEIMSAIKAEFDPNSPPPEPAAEEAPPAEEEAAAAEEMPAEEEEDDEASLAASLVASSRLMRLTGKRDFSEICDVVEDWRKAYLTLESEKSKLAKDRKTLEAGERERLRRTMVRLGMVTHAFSVEDPLAEKPKPAKWLCEIPIDELRTRVAKFARDKGEKIDGSDLPPAGGSPELTDETKARLEKYGVKASKFLAVRQAIRRKSRHSGGGHEVNQ